MTPEQGTFNIYNGTEVDLDALKAKVKSFASPEAVMEELLAHVCI
jgi:hypothetical protein